MTVPFSNVFSISFFLKEIKKYLRGKCPLLHATRNSPVLVPALLWESVQCPAHRVWLVQKFPSLARGQSWSALVSGHCWSGGGSGQWPGPPELSLYSVLEWKEVVCALDFFSHCSVGHVLIHKMTGKQLMDDSYNLHLLRKNINIMGNINGAQKS